MLRFQAGQSRLYVGDCILMLRELPSGSVDLIIADPPYYRMCGGRFKPGGLISPFMGEKLRGEKDYHLLQ